MRPQYRPNSIIIPYVIKSQHPGGCAPERLVCDCRPLPSGRIGAFPAAIRRLMEAIQHGLPPTEMYVKRTAPVCCRTCPGPGKQDALGEPERALFLRRKHRGADGDTLAGCGATGRLAWVPWCPSTMTRPRWGVLTALPLQARKRVSAAKEWPPTGDLQSAASARSVHTDCRPDQILPQCRAWVILVAAAVTNDKAAVPPTEFGMEVATAGVLP